MKDVQLRLRSLFTTVILVLFFAFATRAQEASSHNFLSDLHQFRVSNYIALDAYYRFSAVGDTEALNEIVASIKRANIAMNSVAQSTSGILSEQQVESLNLEFGKFKVLMRSNIEDVRNTGYPDLRLVSDMANHALSLNQAATELYTVAQESRDTSTDAGVEAARSAAVTLAQMMAKYSARTNSQVAQTFQGSSDDTPLDVQARQFDALLADIRSAEAGGELKSTLDSISSKWQFIRSSYINFNDNNVAFVIDRYSKAILAGLQTTIDLLTGSA